MLSDFFDGRRSTVRHDNAEGDVLGFSLVRRFCHGFDVADRVRPVTPSNVEGLLRWAVVLFFWVSSNGDALSSGELFLLCQSEKLISVDIFCFCWIFVIDMV